MSRESIFLKFLPFLLIFLRQSWAIGPNTVITSSGICADGCDIADGLKAFEGDLKLHPDEPATQGTTDEIHGKYFFYHEDDKFQYCVTTKGTHVRCSNNPANSSTAFEFHAYQNYFKGYVVKDSLPCEGPCTYDSATESLTCKVDWDMFDSMQQCSLHRDFDKISENFYQISLPGLILGTLNENDESEGCISPSTNERGWEVVTPCKIPEGLHDLSGTPCSSECLLHDDELMCSLEDGQQSPCTINLPNVGEDSPKCEIWVELRGSTEEATPPFAENQYCIAGNVFINQPEIVISQALLDTDQFRCESGETAKYVTLLAEKSITIDADIEIFGGIDRPFLQITIVSKTIVIDQNKVINLKGSDSAEGTFERANGGAGGRLLAVALYWENPEGLSVDASGGDSGCSVVPLYVESGANEKAPYGFQVDLDQSKFTYKHLSDESATCESTCYLFEVHGALKAENATGGPSGTVHIYGTEVVSTVVVDGQSDQCDSEAPPSGACVRMLYGGRGDWYAQPLTIPLRDRPTVDNSYIPAIREWIADLDEDEWTDDEVVKISELVDDASSDLGLDSPDAFFEELKLIITKSETINNDLETRLLESLEKRLREFPSDDSSDSSLLLWLYTAAAAHHYRIQGQNDLILNLEGYITATADEIQPLSDADQRDRFVSRKWKSFKDENYSKLRLASTILSDALIPELDDVRDKLFTQLKLYRRQIKNMLRQSVHGAELTVLLEKSVRSKFAAVALNSLKAFSGVLRCFQRPMGTVIGVGVPGSTSLSQTATGNALYAGEIGVIPKKLPVEIWRELKPATNMIKMLYSQLISNIEKILTQFQSDADVAGFIDFATKKLEELREVDHAQIPTVTKRQQYEAVRKIYREILQELQNTGSAQIEVTNILTGVYDAVFAYFSDDAELEDFKADIIDVGAAISDMIQFNVDFHDALLPLVLGILDTVDVRTLQLDATLLPFVDLPKMNVLKNVLKLRGLLESIPDVLDAGSDIRAQIDLISKSISDFSTIFRKLEAANHRKRLANLMANTKVAESYDPDSVAGLVEILFETTNQEVIYAEAESAIEAFRQWAFPFAQSHLRDFESLPFSFEDLDAATKVENAVGTLSQLSTVFQEFDNNDARSFVQSATFERGNGHDPFFTWESANHREAIVKLLGANGPVRFYADVERYTEGGRNEGKEAVKFRGEITFSFYVEGNDAKQAEIDAELKRCVLSAMHIGANYYKFQGKTYLFTSTATIYEHSFDWPQSPSGAAVLSPYGLWELEILPQDLDATLDGLVTSPRDIVHLELIGAGEYVPADSGATDEHTQMDKHYKHYEVKTSTTAKRV